MSIQKKSITRYLSRTYLSFSFEDAEKHGLEKAVILSNIESLGDVPDGNFHIYFPYIEKERFYILLQELKNDGLVWEENI